MGKTKQIRVVEIKYTSDYKKQDNLLSEIEDIVIKMLLEYIKK